MNVTTKEMLERLTQEFAPENGKAHALCLATNGELRLVLHLEAGQRIVLNEIDLGQPLEQLVASLRLHTARIFVAQ